MSKADEMFEKLKYYKKESKNIISYENVDIEKFIYFNKNIRMINCENYYDGSGDISMQELQAINEKVKELQWN